tara:strand:+ start:2932 stop:3471 length:540 start_codon:yes stop_codon:yes gene_type:complete
MSPIESHLEWFYPHSDKLSQRRFDELWNTTLTKNPEIYDRSELQQIYETHQPLMGDDKLEVGVLYLLTDRQFSKNSSVHPISNSRIIMVAWGDYLKASGQSPNSPSEANMWFMNNIDEGGDYTNKYTATIQHLTANTVLGWFGYNNSEIPRNGGGIYPIHIISSKSATLNYSRRGFLNA